MSMVWNESSQLTGYVQLVTAPGGSGAFCLRLFLAGACFACSASLCSKKVKELLHVQIRFTATAPSIPFICEGRLVLIDTVW